MRSSFIVVQIRILFMDDKIRQLERQFLTSGNRDDAISYISSLRRVFGKHLKSSLNKLYPQIVAVGNFIPRFTSTSSASWELNLSRRYGSKNSFLRKLNLNSKDAHYIDNFAFYDAIEISPKLARTRGGSPFAVATSIVDGDIFSVTPSYVFKLLPLFRNGIIVGKFTISKRGGVQSLVLEK